MGTRSYIHVQMTDNTWARIYCHWDGYYEHAGNMLQTHYNSQELAEALISLGDISTIGKVIGEKHDFDYDHTFYDRHNGNYAKRDTDPEYIRLREMCLAYGRDRGETGTEARVGATLEEVFEDEEYMYVWRDGQWFGMSYTTDLKKLRPLAEIFAEMARENEEKAA